MPRRTGSSLCAYLVEQAVGAVLDDLKHNRLAHPRGEAGHGLEVDVADPSLGDALDHRHPGVSVAHQRGVDLPGNGGVRGEHADVVAIDVPVGDGRAVGGIEAAARRRALVAVVKAQAGGDLEHEVGVGGSGGQAEQSQRWVHGGAYGRG